MTIATMETNLIVDFPQRRAGNKRRRRPAVQFSSEVDIRFYRPLHVESADAKADAKDDLFYSSRDYRTFKRDHKHAVKELHTRLLLAGVIEDAFDGCELTGMENLLTPELIKRTMIRKTGCVNAVLDAQDECCDPEGIARASRRHSMWAAERSRKIGMMHELI